MKLECPHCNQAIQWKRESQGSRDWQLTRCPHCQGYCMLRSPAAPSTSQASHSASDSVNKNRPTVKKGTRAPRFPERPSTQVRASQVLPEALPEFPPVKHSSRWIPAGLSAAIVIFLLSGWFFLKQAERLQALRGEDKISIRQASPVRR